MNIKIGSRYIGYGYPCFIIAEAGVNHNGNLNLAKQLVLEAKAIGADCIKFQTFKAERVVSKTAPKAGYQLITTDPNETQLEMLKKLELPESAYDELISMCQDLDIIFMSTPYSNEDVDFLDRLGVDAYKLASISISEPSFLRYVAKKNKPMIISTGMATLDEVLSGIEEIKKVGNNNFIPLQCTTNYPAALEDVNLRAMSTIQNALNSPVGYSDHSESNLACLSAVALGACVIEKHFTIDKSLPGPDQSSSYCPGEFKKLIGEIRNIETLLGSNVKSPSEVERINMPGMRRSVVAKNTIYAGTSIEESMLTLKRPGVYLPASEIDFLIGKVAIKDLPIDTFISKEDVR